MKVCSAETPTKALRNGKKLNEIKFFENLALQSGNNIFAKVTLGIFLRKSVRARELILQIQKDQLHLSRG